MAVNCSPFGPKPQFLLADGTPAVGNKLFFYVAGSVNTKQNTYTDSTGGVANTNPIVLNALGQPTTQIWFTAGQSYKVVFAPSTDTDPPTSPIWTIDNLVGINDTSVSIDQWVVGPAPTYVSATSFTLAGDQTSTFQPGRRVKTTNSGGTVYSTISTSVFGAVTTVTVLNDSGTLDVGLSAVSYGLLSSDNPSTPLLTDTYPIVSGSADKTKLVRLEADGLTTATTRVVTVPDRDVTINNLTSITASLGADVSLNNTGSYFDGPSVAQGTSGTWFVSGSVTLVDTAGAATMNVKLWDGTTVVASSSINLISANARQCVALSGVITSPAGNLRISVNDATSTSGIIRFNSSANSKDSTITAARIG